VVAVAGTDMRIELLGDPIVRRLGRVKHHLENWAPVWPEVIEHLERGAKCQFDSHGVYGSGGWAPLAESTLRRKRAKGFPPDILRATGRLEDSLTVEDHPEHVQVATTDSLWWGTTVPYAGYHQHGTDNMPMRKVIEPPEGSRRYMVRILQRYALANAPTVGVTA
jgi:phage gpG-like protein